MPKDPNKPKGRRSAYAYHVSDVRKDLRTNFPDRSFGFAEFSRISSERWKSLSVEKKKHFISLADQDKKRYEEEMKHYTPPPMDGRQVRANGQKRKVGGLKVKDPNAPKRAQSAYAYFCKQYRHQVRESNKNLSSSDVTKELKKYWDSLVNNEIKLVFENRAAQDRERFRKEKEAYDRRNDAELQRSASGKMPRMTQGHPQPQIILDYDNDDVEDSDDEDDKEGDQADADDEKSGGDFE